MCCCCFCCFRPKGNRGSRNWLCMFLLSMFLSIVVVAILAGMEIYFGGPIPTHKYDAASKVAYTSNAISFVFSILAIVIIVRVIPNRIFGLVTLIGLIISLLLNVYSVIAMSHIPGGDEMSPYVTAFYKKHSKAPPILELIQKLASSTDAFACCGGKSFKDYAVVNKRYVIGQLPNVTGRTGRSKNPPIEKENKLTGHYVFDAPHSCCAPKFKADPNCGNNLVMYYHSMALTLVHETVENIKDVSDFKQEFDRILELGLGNMPNFGNDFIPPKSAYDVSSEAEKARQEHINEQRFRDFHIYFEDEVKVSPLGCGRVFDEVYMNRIRHPYQFATEHLATVAKFLLGFAIMKFLISVATVGIYVYYFYTHNFHPAWVYPEDSEGQPLEGLAEDGNDLSRFEEAFHGGGAREEAERPTTPEAIPSPKSKSPQPQPTV